MFAEILDRDVDLNLYNGYEEYAPEGFHTPEFAGLVHRLISEALEANSQRVELQEGDIDITGAMYPSGVAGVDGYFAVQFQGARASRSVIL